MSENFILLWAVFLTKFSPANEKEHLLVKYLYSTMEMHYTKWEKNKKAHFSQEKEIGKRSFWASFTGGGKLRSPLVIYPVIYFIFTLISFGMNMVYVDNQLYKMLFVIIFVFITIVLVIVTALINQSVYKKTQMFQLKKHAETWVRHCCAYSLLEQEVRKFTCDIAPYTGKVELSDQKKIFCKNIEDLYQKDLEQFQENMKLKEEVVI